MRAKRGVRHRPLPDETVPEAIRHGKQAHAEVVRHDAAHDLPLAAAAARGRAVKRLIKAVWSQHAEPLEMPEIAHRRARLHCEGEKGAVGR